MRSHGFVTEDTPHTRIPGIWRKLNQLYDVQALDDREMAYAFHNDPDPLDPDEAVNIPDFELPEEEYGDLIWQKRFHGPDSEASSSPPLMPTEDDKLMFQPGVGLLKDLQDGARSQKTESVADATPPAKNAKTTRASRAAAAKTGKATKAGKNDKNSNSKAQSVEEESVEDEESEAEDKENSAESSEEVTAPSTRRTNRSTGTTKPLPKRTRKR
jgi:MRG-binding protein